MTDRRDRRVFPERVLLLTAILLQVIILVRLGLPWFDGGEIEQPTAELRENELPENDVSAVPRTDARADTIMPDTIAAVRPYPDIVRAVSRQEPAAEAMAALEDARRLRGQLDRLFTRAMADFERMTAPADIDRSWENLTVSPGMDMRVGRDSYVVLFSLPSEDASMMTVMLEGRMLTVLAPSPEAVPGEQRSYFHRRVQLPGPIGDTRRASADWTNGLLRVVVPRSRSGSVTARRLRLL